MSENNVNESEVVLTDDELYAKIQTEKMVKKRKNQRIFTIVGLCVVFALAVTIICLAVVPIDLRPTFLKDTSNLSYVRVCIDGDAKYGELSSTSTDELVLERYNEFIETFEDAFSTTYFSALFSGGASTYKFSERTSSHGLTDYVLFNFTNSQTLTYKNGKTYSSTINTSVKSFEFTKVYMSLSSTEGDNEAVFYIEVEYPNSDSSTTTYYIKLTTSGDTYSIYNFYNPTDDE